MPRAPEARIISRSMTVTDPGASRRLGQTAHRRNDRQTPEVEVLPRLPRPERSKSEVPKTDRRPRGRKIKRQLLLPGARVASLQRQAKHSDCWPRVTPWRKGQ